MKIVRFNDLTFVPANHEDPKDPGVLKKVLFKHDEMIQGRVQMINWALLPVGKSFRKHYHDNMEEIFVIVHGLVTMTIEDEEETLQKGDSVLIPIGKVHQLKNSGSEDVEYIVIGITRSKTGKTIVV